MKSSSSSPTKDHYKYDDSKEERLGPVPPTSTRQRIALHPVRSFPTGHDTITRAFFGDDVSRHKDNVGRATRWLDPLRIDPTFGMGNDDTQEGRIRRTFRRMESSALFTPPARDSTSLTELIVDTDSPSNSSHSSLYPLTPSPLRHSMVPHGLGHGSREGFEFSESYLSSSSPGMNMVSPLPSLSSSPYGSPSYSPYHTISGSQGHQHHHSSSSHHHHHSSMSTTSSPSSSTTSGSPLKFVLIQEHQLSEFARFENILREERALLGEQCTMVLGNVQVYSITHPHVLSISSYIFSLIHTNSHISSRHHLQNVTGTCQHTITRYTIGITQFMRIRNATNG